MKTKLSILTSISLALSLLGCINPVPRTTFRAVIGGQEFRYSNPKQATATNIVFKVVSTNGTEASMSIGALTSINDPAIVDKSYAGQALVLKTTFDGANQLINTAAAVAGKAAIP